MGKTLFDKVWNKHVLTGKEGDPQLLYIDLHLIHEVTSPQAFEGLRLQNRKLRRPDLTYATLDHNVPTVDIFNIKDEIANKQITTLQDRKSTRLNSSHVSISYAFFHIPFLSFPTRRSSDLHNYYI